MSLLNKLKNSTFLPPKQHTPVIPPHPSIPVCPKNDEILSSGPRKKRISYKSQDEKREALRERSRDNRRKAKERKDYMERRINWLAYENPQLKSIIAQKDAKVESLKKLLAQSGIEWRSLDFYQQGGAEILFRNAGLELPAFTIPEESDSDDDSPDVLRETRSQKKKREENATRARNQSFQESRNIPGFGSNSLSLLDAMKPAMTNDSTSNLEQSDTSSRLFVL